METRDEMISEVEALVRQELTCRIIELRSELKKFKDEMRQCKIKMAALEAALEKRPKLEQYVIDLSWADNMEEVHELRHKYREEWRVKNSAFAEKIRP